MLAQTKEATACVGQDKSEILYMELAIVVPDPLAVDVK